MHDDNEEEKSGSGSARQEGRECQGEEAHREGAIRPGQESYSGAVGESESSKAVSGCVYVLYREDRQVFYVGQTINPVARLGQHRSVLGLDVKMRIIQNTFENRETLEDAERKWIKHYIRQGAKLVNAVLVTEPRERCNSTAALLGAKGGSVAGIKKGLSAMDPVKANEIRAKAAKTRKDNASLRRREAGN